MANCNYKVIIKDIQNKYRFKVFCTGNKTDLSDYYTKEQVDNSQQAQDDEITTLKAQNEYLQNVVNQAFTEVTASGENIKIDNTIEAKMNVSLYGNTKQNGEPTPVTPVEIQRVTGNNKVVVSNKNLLSNNATSQTINGVVFIKNEDGSITAKGTATAVTDIYILGNTTTYKKINGYGNLKLNGCNDGSLSTYMLYCVQNKNGTLSYYQNYKDDINIISTEEDTFRVFIRVMANATINTTFYPMIRFSNTATSYVPHKETIYELDLGNIELCKIGDYQDYFYKNNNKWYKREIIGSLTLDGLNWTAEKISNDIYKMASTSSIFKGETEVSKISELFCNIYKKGSANTTYLKQTGINLYKNFIYVYDSNYNTSTSVNSFKTMLKEKNAILYGILSEPRDIEITDTTLISQLEALKTAMSYTEQTNISQINDDIPFYLDVKALTR